VSGPSDNFYRTGLNPGPTGDIRGMVMKTPSTLLSLLALFGAPAWAATYAGNGNTGFGGVVSSMDVTDDGTNITFTLNRGAGLLNDRFVVYLDSTTGGFSSTTGFNDDADPLRAAISGDGVSSGISTVTFGFDADFALGLDAGFAGLWALNNGGDNAHTFISAVNGSPGGNSQSSYAMTMTLASLGLGPGDTVNFVATYLNADNAFRSGEGIGDGLPGGSDNVGVNPVTFTGFRSYTVVPEPATALLGSLGLLALLRRRK